LFGDQRERSLLAYETFVKEGKDHRPFDHVKAQIFLGSDAFVARFQEEGRKARGVPKKQTDVFRPALVALLSSSNGIKIAQEQGFSIPEIAAELGVHPTTLARRLK
jgi:hypothetical protein